MRATDEESLPATVFVTFGDGNLRWRGAAARLKREAERSRLFQSCHALDAAWLRSWDSAIASQCLQFIDHGEMKGFGYWAWKSSALLWASIMFPGSQVFYLDAGCVIHSGQTARLGLANWLTEADRNGGLCMQLPAHQEVEWCKKETLLSIDPLGEHWYSNQLQAGFIAISADRVQSFATLWREAMLFRGGRLISDAISEEEFPAFRDHRHDQSVFSLLWKQQALPYAPDRTAPIDGGKLRAPQAPDGILTYARYPSRLPYKPSQSLRAIRVVERAASKVERGFSDAAKGLRP